MLVYLLTLVKAALNTSIVELQPPSSLVPEPCILCRQVSLLGLRLIESGMYLTTSFIYLSLPLYTHTFCFDYIYQSFMYLCNLITSSNTILLIRIVKLMLPSS